MISQRIIGAAVLIGMLPLTLTGCTREFAIYIEQHNGKVTIEFKKGLIFKKRYSVCVSRVDVIQRPESELVWTLEARGGVCRNLTGLRIGEIPAGFVETTSKLPLSPGKRYEVGAMGDGEVGVSSRWRYNR